MTSQTGDKTRKSGVSKHKRSVTTTRARTSRGSRLDRKQNALLAGAKRPAKFWWNH